MMTFNELWERLPENIRFDCDNCEQDQIHHPEGNVTEHIKMVFNCVINVYGGDKDLLLCSIFHDLGKPSTMTKAIKGDVLRISNIGHELLCDEYIDKYFHLFSDISTNKEKIKEICLYHMKAHLYVDGLMKKRKKRTNFENLKYYNEIIVFSKCDVFGRS